MTVENVQFLSAAAHEIMNNIRACPELTYQQRNELISLVMTDIREKISLAAGLLDAWRRDDMSGDKPTAA